MEYVFRFLIGFLVTFAGCGVAIFILSRRIEEYKLKLRVYEESLTKPESYIWVRVEAYLPERDGYYLVEYSFESSRNLRFHSVHGFRVSDGRFQPEGFDGLKVHRWAELPK